VNESPLSTVDVLPVSLLRRDFNPTHTIHRRGRRSRNICSSRGVGVETVSRVSRAGAKFRSSSGIARGRAAITTVRCWYERVGGSIGTRRHHPY
jgi:hypothetical protein